MTNDGSKKADLPKKEEELIPRSVPSQPVQFGKRDEILKKFYAQLQLKDKMTAGGDPELKKLMLSEQELIKYALDCEQEAATIFEGTVYQSHLGRQMVLFKKMAPAEWKSFVRDTIRRKETEPESGGGKPQARPSPGLDSPEEEVAILRAIRTSLAGLEKFGYVTVAPTTQEIASAKVAIESSAGWEECNRCNTRFRVFPGRDEEGKELLDVLVRPYGEILDFNTRFSGVSQKQFAEAAPHEGRTLADSGCDALLKVESPAAARYLLFDLISPETPLIGHAIDNDLNTLRIIHPLIVDTVLLYPHPKGLPARFSLKLLAKQHLDRNIQTSGAAGHDSKEDATTTGDLVTLRVREKWKQMRMAGWKFDQGKLVAPVAKAA
ncbi:hypothetical protein DV736_g3338, partial [Chaetothyriales sp. CBS 134916]